MTPRMTRTDAQWRARLSPLQYIVTRKGGSERPGTDPVPDTGSGTFACVCCGARLYSAASRLAPESGFPRFKAALPRAPLALHPDHGWLCRRTRISCARCDARLGFLADGDTGPAHEIYACALRFVPA